MTYSRLLFAFVGLAVMFAGAAALSVGLYSPPSVAVPERWLLVWCGAGITLVGIYLACDPRAARPIHRTCTACNGTGSVRA